MHLTKSYAIINMYLLKMLQDSANSWINIGITLTESPIQGKLYLVNLSLSLFHCNSLQYKKNAMRIITTFTLPAIISINSIQLHIRSGYLSAIISFLFRHMFFIVAIIILGLVKHLQSLVNLHCALWNQDKVSSVLQRVYLVNQKGQFSQHKYNC